MTKMTMSSWKQADMHRVFDEVLIRSAVEFHRALRLLRRYDAAGGSEYVEHMRQGLRAIEAELARRGIEVGITTEARNASEGRSTSIGAKQTDVPVRSRPHERHPIPPPRARQPRKSA